MLGELKSFVYKANELVKQKLFDHILVEGLMYTANFGDALNYPLVKYLSDKYPISAKFARGNLNGNKTYAAIGSIIHFVPENTVVWGAGLISPEHKVPNDLDIRCVRGPLTQQRIEKLGLPCPKTFGDPALLLPLIYKPAIKKKFDVGIMPHQIDQESPLVSKLKSEISNAVVINVNSGIRYKKVINKMLECELIISSSLHGLIVANAYNIPSIWVDFGGKIIGREFKFIDFYQSVGKYNNRVVSITERFKVSSILKHIDEKKIHFDVTPLIKSCPFITVDKRHLLLSKASL